jgi:hypothetical protein
LTLDSNALGLLPKKSEKNVENLETKLIDAPFNKEKYELEVIESGKLSRQELKRKSIFDKLDSPTENTEDQNGKENSEVNITYYFLNLKKKIFTQGAFSIFE